MTPQIGDKIDTGAKLAIVTGIDKGMVSYQILNKRTGEVVPSRIGVPFYAAAIAKDIAEGATFTAGQGGPRKRKKAMETPNGNKNGRADAHDSKKPLSKLPREWVKNHFHSKIIKRQGDVVIVERHHRDTPNNIHFEIAVIEILEAAERFGKHYDDRENYPSSELWGKRAWTVNTREQAEKKFANVCEEFNK